MTSGQETFDWAALARLRARFLAGGAGDYWRSEADLLAYDQTFARRIGWKWDAVLAELAARGWAPPRATVLDWGCGTGIASRRLLAHAGAAACTGIQLHDRSLAAAHFARERLLEAFPGLPWPPQVAGAGGPEMAGPTLLLVSHVINELDSAGLAQLIDLAAAATAVIWIEPGSHSDSRLLLDVRERLRGALRVVAPCTHAQRCGMLAEGCARHWCHHFARSPVEAHTSPTWARFANTMGIDLRSLPYSFLVMQQPAPELRLQPDPAAGWSRLIGRAREYKGYLRPLSCQATGLDEPMLQKRDAKALHKEIRKQAAQPPLYLWRRDGERITGAARWPVAPVTIL